MGVMRKTGFMKVAVSRAVRLQEQLRIQGRGPRGPPPLFLDQAEVQKADPPLSEGLVPLLESAVRTASSIFTVLV